MLFKEKATVHVVVVISYVQRIGYQPEKNALHDGQSRSWTGKREHKEKSDSAPPPPPPTTRCSFGEKINKKSRDASTCLGATQVTVHLASVQNSFDLSTRSKGFASQNSTLPCAKTTLPVSLPLSSPGDV